MITDTTGDNKCEDYEDEEPIRVLSLVQVLNRRNNNLLGVLWFDIDQNTVSITDSFQANAGESTSNFAMLIREMAKGVTGKDSVRGYILRQITSSRARNRYIVNQLDG